jgi:hypothetical protein
LHKIFYKSRTTKQLAVVGWILGNTTGVLHTNISAAIDSHVLQLGTTVGDPYHPEIVRKLLALIKQQSSHFSGEHQARRRADLQAVTYNQFDQSPIKSVEILNIKIDNFNAVTESPDEKIISDKQVLREMYRFFGTAAHFSDTISTFKDYGMTVDSLLSDTTFGTVEEFQRSRIDVLSHNVPQRTSKLGSLYRATNSSFTEVTNCLSRIQSSVSTPSHIPAAPLLHPRTSALLTISRPRHNITGLNMEDELRIDKANADHAVDQRIIYLQYEEAITALTGGTRADRDAQTLVRRTARDIRLVDITATRDTTISEIQRLALQVLHEEQHQIFMAKFGVFQQEFLKSQQQLQLHCQTGCADIASQMSAIILDSSINAEARDARLLQLSNDEKALKVSLITEIARITTEFQWRAEQDELHTLKLRHQLEHEANIQQIVAATVQTELATSKAMIITLEAQLAKMPTLEVITMESIHRQLEGVLARFNPAAFLSILVDVWIRYMNLENHSKKRTGQCTKCQQYGHDSSTCLTKNEKNQICRNFSNNTCTRGDRCRFLHDSAPPTSKPKLAKTGTCTRCGRNSHTATDCVANSDLTGNALPPKQTVIKEKVKVTRVRVMESELDELADIVRINVARILSDNTNLSAYLMKVIDNGALFDTGATMDVVSSSEGLEDYRKMSNMIVEGVNTESPLTIDGIGRHTLYLSSQFPNTFVKFSTIAAVVPGCKTPIIGANKFTTTGPDCHWVAHLEYSNSFLEHVTLQLDATAVRVPLTMHDGLLTLKVLCKDELPLDAVILKGGGVQRSIKANIASIIAHAHPATTRTGGRSSDKSPVQPVPGLEVIISGKIWVNEEARYCRGHIVGLSDKVVVPDGYYDPKEPLWEVEFWNPQTRIYDLYDVCQSDITTTEKDADTCGKLYTDWQLAGRPDLYK